MRASLALIVCAACGGGGSATVVEVPPQELPSQQPTVQVVLAPPQNTSQMRAGEQWMGHYTCAQGNTDLVIHIQNVQGATVDAVFEFLHAPSGANGAYHMRGELDPNGAITFVPGPWIDRPEGYVTVGMRGIVQRSRFSGKIDGPSCTNFSVVRR